MTMLFLRQMFRCQNAFKSVVGNSNHGLTNSKCELTILSTLCAPQLSLILRSSVGPYRQYSKAKLFLGNIYLNDTNSTRPKVSLPPDRRGNVCVPCFSHTQSASLFQYSKVSGSVTLQTEIIRSAHNDVLNRVRGRVLKSPHQKLEKTKIKAKEVKETVEETVREWKEDIVFTVPNLLTSSRIVMSPILGYLVLQESYSWACGLFVVAGITDLLDGYIARNFPNQASAFGSYLDPLADKLLACILFMSLTLVNLIPVPLTALVIARDVSLIAAAFYVRYITLPPPKTIKRYFDVTHATAQLQPTFISKLNTAVQLSLVTATLAAPVFGYVDHIMLQTLWFITAGTTIASGITYIFAHDTFKILQQTKKKKK